MGLSQCIIIIGMHRSGSSITARIFHELGVYLTDTPGIYDPSNEEGEYENLDFVALNNDLLKESGGSWNEPVMVNKSDTRCEKLINKYRNNLWGWKDNRTAFTFKCYEQYLKNDNILFVITHRDRDNVIQSIVHSRMNQFPKDKQNKEYIGWLYDKYYQAIDHTIKGYNRLDIHYEDLVRNPFYNPRLKHYGK